MTFWPKSRRLVSRMRFSIRWLIVAVLVTGLTCGGLIRWYIQQRWRQGLVAHLHVQQQVTNSVIYEALADVRADHSAVWRNLAVSTSDEFSRDKWTVEVEAHETLDGQRMPRIHLQVSGGCDDDVLRHIAIKASGASVEGQLVDRLVATYRTRGWKYDVVPPSDTNK